MYRRFSTWSSVPISPLDAFSSVCYQIRFTKSHSVCMGFHTIFRLPPPVPKTCMFTSSGDSKSAQGVSESLRAAGFRLRDICCWSRATGAQMSQHIMSRWHLATGVWSVERRLVLLTMLWVTVVCKHNLFNTTDAVMLFLLAHVTRRIIKQHKPQCRNPQSKSKIIGFWDITLKPMLRYGCITCARRKMCVCI